jgi:hypothetical protein
LYRKKEDPLHAGENRLLEGGRKEFEYPNFDLDDADELSLTLILKTDYFVPFTEQSFFA